MGDVPATVVADPSTPGSSEWHSIRPWTPHLTLAVREITSVSATFILSSSLDSSHTTEDEPQPELPRDTSDDTSNDAILGSRGIIADAMSHGLSVDVNGSNWQRVILRMNDHADEAIIVIYGLHPGRQYDIDLALVSGGTMRKQVTTEDAESTTLDNERGDDHHVIAAPEALSTSTSVVNESSSSVPSTSQTPTPEDNLRTLSHQLNALHAEQATLQAALRSSRRDANKTTNSLRTEIDAMKRASEKAGIAESKGRQRVRALEDAVRRANEGREQVEQQTAVDEQELPTLRGKQSEAEDILRTVKKEADAVRAEREKQEEERRKRKESMKGECATLSQRLERLTVKKEKLEKSVIPNLETQLVETQRDIVVEERGSLQNADLWDSLYGDPSRTETQRRRQSHPGTIGRPLARRTCPPPISPPQFPRHQPRSQPSYRAAGDLGASHPPSLSHPPGLLHSPPTPASHPAPSGMTYPMTPGLSHSTSTILSQSTSSSLSRSTSSIGSSTLSSKAAPFEPTRNLRVSLSSPTSAGFPSSGLFPVSSSQGSFSPSSTTLTSPGSSPGFPLSAGTHPSAQRPPQALHRVHDADLGGKPVRVGRSPTVPRGSGSEDPWAMSHS